MLKFAKLFCGVFFLFSSGITHSHDVSMYFGADSQLCRTHFEDHFGGNILKKEALGLNPFFGINLNSVFSVEIGHQYLKSSKTRTLHTNEYSAGLRMPEILTPVTFKSSFILKGPHINLLASTPTYSQLPVQFFGGIGISHTKATFLRKTMQIYDIVGIRTRRIEAYRSLTRLTFGMNYFFNKDFAIRASIVFLNTHKLQAFANDGIYNIQSPEIRPKNSICYGIGLRWGF